MTNKGRKGRQGRQGQEGGNAPQTPRTSGSQTPRKSESETPRKGHHNQHNQQNQQPKAKGGANKENENPMSKAQRALVRKYVNEMFAKGQIKRPNQQDPELANNSKGNDKQMDKASTLLSKTYASARPWSNYPIALPPQLNAQTINDMRKALATINDKEMFNYCSEAKRGADSYELGVLQCYEGVQLNKASNFLSCDFVNPEYLKECSKPAELVGVKRQMDEWLSNKSCFVYAPVNTLLTKFESLAGASAVIDLSVARQLWHSFALSGRAPQSIRSPGYESAAQLCGGSFWLYTEEFVEYQNRDVNPFHPAYDPVKNKGRIGMFFNIKPFIPAENTVLHYMNVPKDSIGWGCVGRIGAVLEQDYEPETWDDLQNKIGRYILLTNVWSSTSADPYESIVDKTVLKNIYARVLQMTTENMIVNVRRGSGAYGRLCVIEKQIVLDQADEKFGIVGTDGSRTGKDKTELWVTQLFTCRNKLTAEGAKEFERKPITAAHELHSKMSVEEKNLCNIFQSFNNKAIECMKNQAYREVMVDFWKDEDKEHFCALMQNVAGPQKWTMHNAKAMLITMLATSYNVMFQRLTCKVACVERYTRFLEILRYYRPWFVDSKCMADLEHVKTYEENQLALMTDAQAFNGMYSEFVRKPGTRNARDTKEPEFFYVSHDEITYKTTLRGRAEIGPPPARHAIGSDNTGDPSVRQMKLHVIEGNIRAYVRAIVLDWVNANATSGVNLQDAKAQVESGKVRPLDPSLLTVAAGRQKMAYDVYENFVNKKGLGVVTTFDLSWNHVYSYYLQNPASDIVAYFKEEERLYDMTSLDELS